MFIVSDYWTVNNIYLQITTVVDPLCINIVLCQNSKQNYRIQRIDSWACSLQTSISYGLPKPI